MKNFKEYLAESVQDNIYKFVVKVAGELPESFEKQAGNALNKYVNLKFKKLRTTPIQAELTDFPGINNSETHVFEAEVYYPVTPTMLMSDISSCTGLNEKLILIRTATEDQLIADNDLEDQGNKNPKNPKALLNTDYEKTPKKELDALYGDKFIANFLKTGKIKDGLLTQYKGVNDQLLAKKEPKSTD